MKLIVCVPMLFIVEESEAGVWSALHRAAKYVVELGLESWWSGVPACGFDCHLFCSSDKLVGGKNHCPCLHKFVQEVHISFFFFKKHFTYLLCVCVYVCACMHTMVCMWRLEDSLLESVLSFHYVGLGDWWSDLAANTFAHWAISSAHRVHFDGGACSCTAALWWVRARSDGRIHPFKTCLLSTCCTLVLLLKLRIWAEGNILLFMLKNCKFSVV